MYVFKYSILENTQPVYMQGLLKGAHGVFFVYDITNESSYYNINQWFSDVDRYAASTVQKVLIGNKCDLTNRMVDNSTGLDLAERLNMSFFMETSAKYATNVENAFTKMAEVIKKNLPVGGDSAADKKKGGASSGDASSEGKCCLLM